MKLIYIVEDDEGIRELIQFLLENEGYEVLSFSTIEKFQQQIEISFPDLLLMDIRMPDGDGRAVCRELRSTKALAQLPVILMSANTYPSEIDYANDFISKPFDIGDLLLRIQKQLIRV